MRTPSLQALLAELKTPNQISVLGNDCSLLTSDAPISAVLSSGIEIAGLVLGQQPLRHLSRLNSDRKGSQLGPPWLMINGSDDRYQILAATGLNIDPILVVAKTLNIGIYWLELKSR